MAYKGWEEVLRDFTLDPDKEPDWQTVWKYYMLFRDERGIKWQCDTSGCFCQKHPPTWNGTPLVLQLDHYNGNPKDHQPSNLRFLCPNCHTQTPTYAGNNKGRVTDLRGNEYTVYSHDWQSRQFTIRASGGAMVGGVAIVEHIKADNTAATGGGGSSAGDGTRVSEPKD